MNWLDLFTELSHISPWTGLWSQQPLVEKLPVQCHPAHKTLYRECLAMSTGYLSWSWQIPLYSSPITLVTSSGNHHTLPHSPTLIVFGNLHILRRERAMPESVVLQGVISSMLGSFCPDTYHILSISSSKQQYSAACICLINSKFGNGSQGYFLGSW